MKDRGAWVQLALQSAVSGQAPRSSPLGPSAGLEQAHRTQQQSVLSETLIRTSLCQETAL